jgi:hypothetical protein
VLLGNRKNSWQDIDYVLGYFGRRKGLARGKYREYVQEGISRGKRPELVGGGLIRSLGGWKEVSGFMASGVRVKGDERILGDGDFVMDVLKASQEEMERRYRLKAVGFNLEKLAGRVSEIFGIETKDLWLSGQYARIVPGRSVFCYWAVRELGLRETEVARRLRLTQPAVCISVRRGEHIAKERGLDILGK